MPKIRRIAAGGLALVLAATLGPPAPADPVRQPPPSPGSQSRTLTLLTGDRVTLVGGQYSVQPGKGRERMSFHANTSDGHQYLVPGDALALVSSGRLDRRLFDLTELVGSGYDDGRRADLPLIVTYPHGASGRFAANAQITAQLSSVDGVATRVPKGGADTLWPALAGDLAGGGVGKVWLDGTLRLSLDQSVPQIGAPAAWQAGYTGAGVKVAVLDTGIDATHPDFAGRLGELRDFTGDGDTNDVVGHGTHVASTIAGSGAASGGRFRGVAPDATLLVGKVCLPQGCPESAIIAGMQWAAEQGATAVNLSLGGPDGPELDPMEQAVNQLTARYGTLFVVAAGNAGPRPDTVRSPGSAEAALTVGAVDKQDQLAPFSSRGPRSYDGLVKPDITAPGVNIVAARAKDSTIGSPFPGNDRYLQLQGTSMATPHVAGGAAVLAAQHPDWPAGRLKATLMSSAKPDPALTPFEQGAGRVDVARAITGVPLSTDPPTLSLASQQWPHQDDQPVSGAVTYYNGGTAEITLSLSPDMRTPNGTPAPAGLFTVSPARFTVPPGGQASATVTADTRVPSPDGVYTGSLVAVAAGVTVRTTLVMDKEVESYNLTVNALDRAGRPTANYGVLIQWLDQDRSTTGSDEDGSVTTRLPKGRYFLHGAVIEPDPDPKAGPVWSAEMIKPLFELTRDETITLDTRMARPVRVTVPSGSAQRLITWVGYWRKRHTGAWFGAQSASSRELLLADLGPKVPRTELVSEVASTWFEPSPTGDPRAIPVMYHTAFFEAGRYFTGFSRDVRRGELAELPASYAAQKPDTFGVKVAQAQPAGITPENGGRGLLGDIVPIIQLPHQRTEYYLADGVRWQHVFAQVDQSIQTQITADPITYRRGKQPPERWNAGVFGPGRPMATRTGDRLSLDLAPFSDQTESHSGVSSTDTARTTLYRNGTRIAETSVAGFITADVPAAVANYRLETEATRSGPADLSTRISCVWTFRSGHARDGRTEPVALTAVRFAPKVDERNSAPAGRPFLVPVYLSRTDGAPDARIRDLTVDVSYDDGATWKEAYLVGNGERWHALLRHPAGAGFVSLRAAASDTRGATVRETIIRAYRLS